MGDFVRQLFQLAVAEDARFQSQQVERGREDMLKHGEIFELAGVHQPGRIDFAAIGAQRRDALRFQVLEFGDADAVLAGHHAAQFDTLNIT